MTPDSFKAWRVRLYGERGKTAAAEALGCSRISVLAWETGRSEIPRYIVLACQALSKQLRLEAYEEANARFPLPLSGTRDID